MSLYGCVVALTTICTVLSASYGCCQDGLTAAQGPNKEGCVEYVAPAPTVSLEKSGKPADESETSASKTISRIMFFKRVLRLLLFPLRMQYSAGPPPTGAATTAPHLQEDLMERAAPTPPTTVREWAEDHAMRHSVCSGCDYFSHENCEPS